MVIRFLFLVAGFLSLPFYALCGSIPASANVLTFGDDNTLFIADSRSATIYAYKVSSPPNNGSAMSFNITGFDGKVAGLLHVTPDKLLARGFAINPSNKEAYISFDVILGDRYVPEVIIATQSGKLRRLDLLQTPHTEQKLKDGNTRDFKLWSDIPLRSLTITDMKYHKGKVYICGLSNAEFSSTLRIVDYPFTGSAISASIEMYHTSHDQMETRAPMRNLEFFTVEGKEYLVGSYTCTPLVAVSLDELKDGAHVTGTTLAEMAVGNTPIDLFSYMAEDWNKNRYAVMLLTNKNHPAELIKVTDLIAAIGQPGMMTPVSMNGVDKAGMPSEDIPQLIGLVHACDQDPYRIATLRRNLETGTLDLYSLLKGAWIRMDEFESEFAFPGYRYTPAKKMIRDFQGMNLKDIGKGDKFNPRDK